LLDFWQFVAIISVQIWRGGSYEKEELVSAIGTDHAGRMVRHQPSGMG
jgi:hypothetical protein